MNTLAGGGALVTLPALLLLGLPVGVANGTNRLGVLVQSATGAIAFHRHGKLDPSSFWPIAVPMLVGSVGGALVATHLSDEVLRPIFLAVMVGMGLLFALCPAVVAPPKDVLVRHISDRPFVVVTLVAAGFYGGFLQAGIGIVMLAILTGLLRYDLVAANALKVTAIGLYTSAALAIFVIAGDVRWVPGLALAAGSVLGARIGVRFAVQRGQAFIRWLVVAVIVAAIAKEIAL